jgi:hypothetical protein
MTNFKSDDAVFRSFGGKSGPGDARGEVARPTPSGEGYIVVPPMSAGSAAATVIEVTLRDGGREPDQPRSEADDTRVCWHEGSHATVGRILGQPLGGMTAEPGLGFSGRVWGP